MNHSKNSSKHHYAKTLFACILLSIGCRTPSNMDTPPIDTDKTDTSDSATDRFDTLIANLAVDLAASEAPGASIAVLENGEITLAHAIGTKSAGGDEPVNPETLFQLASVTKMLTSMSLIQQINAAGISIDASLADVYADSEFDKDKGWNDQIRLRDLLTHSSGFYDWSGNAGIAADDYLQTWFEEIFFPNLWLMNPPQLFWNYNNPGYSLAGLIAEQLDENNRAFADILREDIFAPLGMERSYLRKKEARNDGNYAESVGWTSAADGTASYGSVSMGDLSDWAQARPAGSASWSTPTQMMEVAKHLLTDEPSLIDQASHDDMRSALVPIKSSYYDVGLSYGYGLMRMEGLVFDEVYYPETILTHNGAGGSFSATFWVFPDKNAAFCVLASGYGASFTTTIEEAFRLLAGMDDGEEPTVFPTDVDKLDLRVGTYEDVHNVGPIEIARVGNQLTIDMPLLTELGMAVQPSLTMLNDALFYVSIDDVYYDLTFHGEEGQASDYVANRTFVGTRVSETSPESAQLLPVNRAKKREEIRAMLRESKSSRSELIFGGAPQSP